MKRYGWWMAALLLAAATSACSRRRVHECTALVERINAADAAIQKGGGTGDRSQRLANMAKTIESERSAVVALTVKDPKLRSLRDDYGTILDEISRASKNVLESSRSNDVSAIQASIAHVQVAGAKEPRW